MNLPFDTLSVDIDWVMDYEGQVFSCRARVKIRVGDFIRYAYETSTRGQINAFDLALRKVLTEFYPFINDIELVKYEVSLLGEEKGTNAHIKVKITLRYKEREWSNEVIGADLVSASIESLSNCYKSAIIDLSEPQGGIS